MPCTFLGMERKREPSGALTFLAYRTCRESVAIIDASDTCVGVLVAPPKGESFQNSGGAVADLIESQRTQRPRAWAHALGRKRGDFPSLSAGINYNYTEGVSGTRRFIVLSSHRPPSAPRT